MTINNATNSNVSYTGLVEKYIGTAYDTVKVVADNITNVVLVGSNIDDILAVADIPGIENIEQLANDAIVAAAEADISAMSANAAADSMNAIHLGGFLIPPIVDNNGNPLVAGTTYTDLNIDPVGMKQWNGTTWLITYSTSAFIKNISDTPPVGPTPGTQWTDSTTMKDYTFYDDGDSQQWIRVN